MGQTRIGGYLSRVRLELHDAFTEDHTPREIAGSFALGTFITMLPTLGLGLLVFAVIIYVSSWTSKIALFASVIVFNPVVKWGVYAASFTLGVLLVGPVEGVTMTDVSFSAGPEIVLRLLVGNLILAVVATVIGYVVVHRLVVRYRATPVGEAIDEALDEIAEGVTEK